MLLLRLTLLACLTLPLWQRQLPACQQAPRPTPTQREKANYLRGEFARLDANEDGRITASEYAQNAQATIETAERLIKVHDYHPSLVSQLYAWDQRSHDKLPEFAQIDKNGDGLVSFHHEFLGFASLQLARFDGWDQNDDGQITKSEFLTAPQPDEVERIQDDPYDVVKQDPAATEVRRRRLGLEFDLRDRNRDGRVTWIEQIALNALLPPETYEGMNALAAFLNVDENFNGVVSRVEFLAHAQDKTRFDNAYREMEETVFRLRDLDGNKELSFLEFVQTGENLARGFAAADKNLDGILLFDDFKGMTWFTSEPSPDRERCHFARLDNNQDRRVTWKEYRSVTGRGVAFGAIDLLETDNVLSRKEWEAVEQEYRDGQSGKQINPQGRSFYATWWLPGIFELISFADLDGNKDGQISWVEFEGFGR